MAIADWIREATERRRRRWRAEEYEKGFAEGYHMGYDDALAVRPRRFPAPLNRRSEFDPVRQSQSPAD